MAKLYQDWNINVGTVMSPMLFGIMWNNKQGVKELIENGADVNEVVSGNCLLVHAIEYRRSDIVKLLISHPHIDINFKHGLAVPPLHIGILDSSLDIVELLLNSTKIDLNTASPLGVTALHVACARGRIGALQLLLQPKNFKKLNTDQVCKRGFTASHYACEGGYVSVVRILVEHEIFDGTVQSPCGSPLEVACTLNYVNILKYVFQKLDAILKKLDKSSVEAHNTFIQLTRKAALLGHVEIVKLLINNTTRQERIKDYIHIVYDLLFANKSETACLLLDAIYDNTNCALIYAIEFLWQELLQSRWSHSNKLLRRMFALWDKTVRLAHGLSSLFIFVLTGTYPSNEKNKVLLNHTRLNRQVVIFRRIKCLQKSESYMQDMLYIGLKSGLVELVELTVEFFSHLCQESLFSETLKGKNISMIQISMKNKEITQLFAEKLRIANYPNTNECKSYEEWYKFLSEISFSLGYDRNALDSVSENDIESIKEMMQTLKSHREEMQSFLCFDFTELTRACKMAERVKHYIECFYKLPEKQQVVNTIKKLVDALSKRVCIANPFFHFKPKLVGSAKEGTRPFIPDEFDFLLLCDVFQKYVRIRDVPGEYAAAFLTVTDEGLQSTHVKQFTTNGRDFDSDKFKRTMDDLIEEALYKTIPNFSHCLSIERNYSERKQIQCIHVIWRGKQYKDMEITIDLVPAFLYRDFCPVRIPIALQNPCEYYLFFKVTENKENVTAKARTHPVAFSDLELSTLFTLPRSARDGLKLAKAMRVGKMFPASIIERLNCVFTTEDNLRTYMLKTCLIYCARNLLHLGIDLNLKAEEWAVVIYKHLEARLAAGILPTLEDGNMRNYVQLSKRQYLFYCDDFQEAEIPPDELRPCCINRNNLLVITRWILQVLVIMCARHGSDITRLLEIAQLAACTEYPKEFSHTYAKIKEVIASM